MKFLLIFIGLLCFNHIEAKQKFYKWTDADGNTHYSEQKPKNKQVDEVKVYSGSSSVQNNSSNDEPGEPESGEEKSEEEKAIDEYNANEKARVNKLQSKENCKAAKKNLDTLQRTFLFKQKDPETGKLVYVNNDNRKAMIKRAKKTIKKNCK